MREWGLTVSERQVDINDLIAGVRSGLVDEVWGVGTAAVVSPLANSPIVMRPSLLAMARPVPSHNASMTLSPPAHHGGDDPYGWRVDVTKGDGA